MSETKGYYSVIQYCPDRSRMEAVNVGVLLLCPEIGEVKARTAKGNQRVARLFGRESYDPERLRAAKRAIERRVEVDRDAFRTPEDLVRFMDTRGNDIQLTPPRPMRVNDPASEIETLFKELVGGQARRATKAPELPALDRMFRSPSLRGRVLFEQEITIPVVGRTLKVPYAFRNGALNLVKPQRFAGDEHRATSAAMHLAIEGDLLQRHPEGNEARMLIVVPAFECSEVLNRVRQRVDAVLGEYGVRVVHEDNVASLAAEVESHSH